MADFDDKEPQPQAKPPAAPKRGHAPAPKRPAGLLTPDRAGPKRAHNPGVAKQPAGLRRPGHAGQRTSQADATSRPAAEHDLVATLMRDVQTGMAAATRLREQILPAFATLAEGGKPSLGMPELEARAALRELKDALDHLALYVEKPSLRLTLSLPDEIIKGHAMLARAHAELKARTDALSKRYASRGASSSSATERSAHIHRPRKIELGETEVNGTSNHRVLLYADAPAGAHQGPAITPKVVGIPGLDVTYAPFWLPTTSRDDIELRFRPVRPGSVAGSLDLGIADDGYYQNVEIPISGTAHKAATPTVKAPLPRAVDIGEQIVGSKHRFTIATLAASGGGKLHLTIKPPRAQNDLEELAATSGFQVGPSPVRVDGRDDQIDVWFEPKFGGMYHADLEVFIMWDNGEAFEHTIHVTAGARDLTEAPAQPDQREPGATPPLPADGRIKNLDEEKGDSFDSQRADAANAAWRLAEDQLAGVALVEDEISHGKHRPAPASLVGQLAKTAITMAVGGLASVVAKSIATSIVSAIGDPKASPKITDGLGSAIKDGLKLNAKQVTEGSAGARPGSTRAQGDDPDQESTDPIVDFFARQKTYLRALRDKNYDLVVMEARRQRPALQANPDAAKLALKRIQVAFEEAKKSASEDQARATVSQWAIGLAHEDLGTTSVSRGGKRVGEATALSPRSSVDRKGVLELYVTHRERTFDPGSLRVDRAEMYGVVDNAARRLTEQAILELAIPVRIVVSSPAGTGFISRDELGRVFIDGALPLRSEEDRGKPVNIQRNRDATELCERLLSKPLVAWGIKKIKTDVAGPAGKADA